MTATRYLSLLALTAAVLTGCTPTAPSTEGSSRDDGKSSGVTAQGTKCEDNTSGVELFSDPSIGKSPEYGQVWGDGSPLVISYDDYTDGTLSYEISYVQDNGGAIPVTGGFFPDPVDKTFTSNDLYFDSTSDGYYGIVDIAITSGTTTTPLGAYCVVLAVSE